MSYKLCFVRDHKAYFTTQEPGEVWGDDWDDHPYEHNAGLPYTRDGHDILCVYFDADLKEACQQPGSFSAEELNAGEFPWLMQGFRKDDLRIYAGTTIDEFIVTIDRIGGTVYLPHNKSILK